MSDEFARALEDMGDWKFDDTRPTRQNNWDRAICAAVEELCAIVEARMGEGHESGLVRRAREAVASVRRGPPPPTELPFAPWRGPATHADKSRPVQRALVTALDELDEEFRAHVPSPKRFETEALKEAKGLAGYLKTVFMREDDLYV